MHAPRGVNLTQLTDELAAAGVVVGGLVATEQLGGGADVREVIDATGRLGDLVAAAAPVLQAHVPTDVRRAGVVAAATSAVGVPLAQLSAVQQRALLACLLWRANALDDALQVRPLAEWLR